MARTSTFALTNITLPYALQLANKGFHQAVIEDPALARGVNLYLGQVTCENVARDLSYSLTPLKSVCHFP